MKRKILIISLILVSMMFFVMCLPGDGTEANFQTTLDENFNSTTIGELPAEWLGGVITSSEGNKVRVVKDPKIDNQFVMIMDNVLAKKKEGEPTYGKGNTGSAWVSFPLEAEKDGTLTFKIIRHAQMEGTTYLDPKDEVQFYVGVDPSKFNNGKPSDAPKWTSKGTALEGKEVSYTIKKGKHWLTWRGEKNGTDYLEDLFYLDDVKFTPNED